MDRQCNWCFEEFALEEFTQGFDDERYGMPREVLICPNCDSKNKF